MATKKKLLEAAAGSAGGAGGLNVEEVFSTYLYEGDGTYDRDIVNGIDLASNGGLVWLKTRSTAYNHFINSPSDITGYAQLPSTSAWTTSSNLVTFNEDGFKIPIPYSGANAANSTSSMCSWTFRKAPKFFDVVTWTGNGTAGRTVSHNLGSVPGCIIVKNLSTGSTDWSTYHRSQGATKYGKLNTSDAFSGAFTGQWNETEPTDSVFTVGDSLFVNQNGDNYVAYLFAHNDGDGDFGPTGDQDIIKCGSYTGTGSAGNQVTLGWEPQWLLIKRTDSAQQWPMVDIMRGATADGTIQQLRAQSASAESTVGGKASPNATGFALNDADAEWNASGGTYIYIAIRRGPMAVPESGTDVFAMDQGDGSSVPAFNAGFPVDFALLRRPATAEDNRVSARLTGNGFMATNLTSAEDTTNTNYKFDYQDGFFAAALPSTYYSWMWKRAPSFFDVVAYTGNGTAGHTVSHNLGVAPEMWIVKRRDAVDYWVVGTSVRGSSVVELDNNNAEYNAGSAYFSDGTSYKAPTESEIFLGSNNRTNISGGNFIAYLFASLDGVSKVGSYTGNGSTQNIDCGFSSGARFVLIKKTSNTGSWIIHDTERGIVSGNDPFLLLNDTQAEVSTIDPIDPNSAGFTVNNYGDWNNSGDTYIFYAIA